MNPYRTFAVRLTGRRTVSPSFVRITLAGDDLASCSPVLLDQRVKLVLGDADVIAGLADSDNWYQAWLALPDADRPAMRTYTLVAVRPGSGGAGEVDIDVAVHPWDGEAPGMDYATKAALGTPAVLVAGDAGHPGHDTVGVAWRPGAAAEVLLVGDETALPAICNIAATLAPSMRGRIVVEVPHEGDVRPISAPTGVVVEWRVRERGERVAGVFGRPVADTEADGEDLWEEVDGHAGRYGWVAGEANWVRELRAEARTADVPKGQVAFMGYWKKGAAGD